MKIKFKVLIATVVLCIATAVVAMAASEYETVLGYANKTYILSLTGDYSKMTGQGTASSIYTTVRNTSSAGIYAQATTKTATTHWAVYDIDTNTNANLGSNQVVNAPTVNRLYGDLDAKYIHVGTAKNVAQTITYDSLTYRVSHDTNSY